MENEDSQFLLEMIKKIVDKQDKVKVTREVDDQGIKLTLFVDQSDMGKVIGSQGRMATALRTVMHAYAGQQKEKISVLIAEPGETEAGHRDL